MNRFDLNRINGDNLTPELLLDMFNFTYNALNIISSKTTPFIEDDYRIKDSEINKFRKYNNEYNEERSKYWIEHLKTYLYPLDYIKYTVELLRERENIFYNSIEAYRKSTDVNECKRLLTEFQDFIVLMAFTSNRICEYLILQYYGVNLLTDLENPSYYGILSELSATICQVHNLLKIYDLDIDKDKYRMMGYTQAIFMTMQAFEELDLPTSIDLYNKIGLLTLNDVNYIMDHYNSKYNQFKAINSEYLN